MSSMNKNMRNICHKYLDAVSGLLGNTGRLLKSAVLLTAGLAVWACGPEEEFRNEDRPEGLPSEVSLRLSLPDMEVQTRALTDDQASAVNNIWIGIYDAGSGGRLKGTYYQEVSHSDRHVMHQIGGIRTSSGNSYIVAVANAGDNYGMSNLVGPQDGTRTNLLDLLNEADTYEKFRSIAVALNDPVTVEYTDANVVMTGTYSSDAGGKHPGGPDVEEVYIKGGNCVLDGRIHLRRVISQVTFNIRGGDGITLRPTSWRVVNNPRMSFLQEREDNDADGLTNASDAITGHLADGVTPNYGASVPETEIAGSSAAGYSFSFYTYENKRTGVAADYDAREKEYKTDDGKNSGVFVALCEDGRLPDLKSGVNRNNYATYVELVCEVSYMARRDSGNEVQRIGKAVYVVHLGYMGNDPGDFNVRRNYKYEYDMTVLGLNQIVLEAKSTQLADEVHPGLEGEVIDATEKIVTVDAHYGMYNISLSNSERARLYYVINVPYGDEPVKEIYGGFQTGSGEPLSNDPQNEYYNWIRIKPAPSENVFAEYKTSAADEPWYLDDLVGVDAAHRGYGDNAGSPDDDTQRWYTVFINENVYEGDGHPLSDWVNFVNKDMRTVLFLVQDVAVSPDTESRYSQGKYLIRQRSIQTYYSADIEDYDGSEPTALGVEHINESYGKNIDWRWTATVSSPDNTALASTELSNSNGRWNLWKFLNNATNAKSNGNLTNSEATRSWWCNNALTGDNGINSAYGIIRYVNAGGTDQNRRTGYIRADEEGYAVPALAYYGSPSVADRNQDPQNVARYYEASALCMSRNRDLDGDGRISPDEVRWYLPAEGKYERIMLGRNALVTPLFSVSNGYYFTNSSDDIAVENENFGYDSDLIGYGADNQVQFISSDHMKFFTEEGGSYHNNIRIYWLPGSDNSYTSRYPWNIRCVRNLGVDSGTVREDPNDDPVEKAYSYDGSQRIFDMTHYYGNSLRAAIDTYIEVHTILDLDKNKTPKKLKVSESEASYTIGTVFNGEIYNNVKDALNANAPCAGYSEADDGGATWRAPNQRELMMMLNEGVINTTTFSCTMEGYGTKDRFACSNSQHMFMNRQLPGNNVSFSVRCVRDLE